MELQASRLAARADARGRPVLLMDQDRARWDLLPDPIADWLRCARAESLAAARPAREDTDWPRIVALYDALVQAMPSPVAELNRAVAVGMAFGPRAALDLVDALEAEGALATTGCPARAATCWPSWAGMPRRARPRTRRRHDRNARERDMLLARAAQMRDGPA